MKKRLGAVSAAMIDKANETGGEVVFGPSDKIGGTI